MATAYRPVQPRAHTMKHKHIATAPDVTMSLPDKSNEPLPLPPILRLPEELRLAIWKLCLAADSPIQWPDNHIDAGLNPGLLRVSKSINVEATPILYRLNTLACQHPSDCNMFGWAHSPQQAKTIQSLALHIRDQDTRLWTAYLGSSNIHRSLIHDFPELKMLNITFRSRYWQVLDGSPLDKFNNWARDQRLKELCEILKEATKDQTKVRILAVHRVPLQEIRDLTQSSQARPQLKFSPPTFEARTAYIKMARAEVALALVPLSSG